ncbi:MAG TPA: hypothetical protein VGD76_20225 [Ramlibacter sp.]
MKISRNARGAALAALALCATGGAGAAGGHHAVDDAAILEAGQCEVEGWFSRARDGERLVHAGANCRVGPVELGAAGEYARLQGSSDTAWGLEAKWAMDIAEGLAIGAKVGPGWAAHVRPRYTGVSASVLASWKPGDTLALHLNAGRDFTHAAADENRYGASLEWTPAPAWSLVGERYKEEGTHFVRAGVRFMGGESWSVDLSRSRRLSGPGVSAWTLGATWAFDR